MRELLHKILNQWFILGLFIVILAAKLQPEVGKKGGPLKPEISIKYCAVSLIFLNSGLSLKTEDLKKALFTIRIHAFIQIFTLVFIPSAVFSLVQLLSYTPLNIWLQNGLLVVSCMPPPVSSAVILTKAVGGNEAAAIFNSVFGSFLGIFVTPALLIILVGAAGSVPIHSVVMMLSATVVAPVIVGQIIRSFVKEWLERANIPFGALGRFTLLMIIYTTFCDTFASESASIKSTDLVMIIVTVVLCQLAFLSLAFVLSTRCCKSEGHCMCAYVRDVQRICYLCKRLSNPIELSHFRYLFLYRVFKSFQAPDVVAIIFCSTHKSLTLGIPMLKIIYSGYPHLSHISIPLLVYHPTQILLGGLLVPIVRSWMTSAMGRVERIEMQEVTSSPRLSPFSA